MVFYKLVAILISAITGDVIGEYEEIHKPMTMERCNERQLEKGVQTAVNGTITIFECRQVEIV